MCEECVRRGPLPQVLIQYLKPLCANYDLLDEAQRKASVLGLRKIFGGASA